MTAAGIGGAIRGHGADILVFGDLAWGIPFPYVDLTRLAAFAGPGYVRGRQGDRQMTDLPQLYLVTPPEIDAAFPDRLARVLDTHEIACLRLDLATRDEDRLIRACDACREIAHRVDVPLVITDHPGLVERLGLDGVHLTNPRTIRKLRADWGDDPIIGAFCGASRHDGMVAGETGADYVAFGPAGATDLGAGERADAELFRWWSEMIEVPVVAEGALDAGVIADLAQACDFLAIGEEIWSANDPSAHLATLTEALRG